jgi:nucleoside-diphosphate-sugar epimerase
VNARTLVTGAPGWLGTSLVEALARGFRAGPVLHAAEPVRVLALPDSDTAPLERLGDVEVVRADLCDEQLPATLLSGIDTVFHSAGVVHPRRIRDLYRVNVQGTRHLLDAAIAAHVRRFVYVSSNSPAGLNLDPQRPMREDDAPRPYLNYGRSKRRAEELVLEEHARGSIEGVIVRPCWFYGPNQPLRQSTFFKMIKQGKPLVFGKGDNLRSMSYVDNIVQGLLLARSVGQAAGQTYWMADRRPYRFLEILETVARLLDVSIEPRHLPAVTSTVARVVDSMLQAVGMYNQYVHVAGEYAASIAVSIDKAQRELGYEPEIELEEGMRRSIDWCRSMGVDI